MGNSSFYSPEAVRPLYGEIALAYQSAFAGEPWFEVSKCADTRQRCTGGLSRVAVGSVCDMCGACPRLPAYEPAELIEGFEQLAASRPTAWYAEQTPGGVALAALSWKAESGVIAKEKYSDTPAMDDWIQETLGAQAVGWLDEVFANRVLRTSGNLRNFGAMCDGFMERLKTDTLAFRTINERMLAVSRRDFGERATVFEQVIDVPDRRAFVVLKGRS
ncbi:MAG TPA: hypothetical protein VLI54_03535 [Bacillota bacterium]|nr:hypothetical protein [Bacillota bacterium]